MRALNRLLLAGATSAFAALASEGVLTIADYPQAFTDHQQLFVEYDSLRGWRNVLNGHGSNVTNEYAVRVDYNAHGYRGPLHGYPKPQGTFRLLMLGDSYLEGYGVNIQDRVAEVAQKRLKARPPAKPVEVIALGTGGYSTDQEDLWLETEGLRYSPDLVVLLFTENDIWYNAQDRYPRGPKPLFRLAGDSVVLTNVPVPRDMLTVDKPAQLGTLHRLKMYVGQHSHLVRLLRLAATRTAWLQSIGLRSGLINAPSASAEKDGKLVTVPAEFAVLADTLSPQADTAMLVTAKLLERMQERTEAANARFIAVMVPANEALYPPGAPRSASYHRDPPFGDIGRPAELFDQLCARARVTCIDPTPRFVTAAESLSKRGQLIIYPIDGHWNENGHRVAGEVIADIARGAQTRGSPHEQLTKAGR